jgi:hypothetical protein
LKKSDGDGPNKGIEGHHARGEPVRPSSLERAFSFPSSVTSIDGVVVLPLSKLLRLLLPPLLISSLPKRAIGFSFPRGAEGKLLGVSLLFGTFTISFLLYSAFGIYAALAMVWLMGGTGAVILYNSMGHGVAFVKQMCSTCRLRPIIEEHEKMHLDGEPSEDAVWEAARKKYTYEGLGLGTDPKIHSFCPIAKRLRSVDAPTRSQG